MLVAAVIYTAAVMHVWGASGLLLHGVCVCAISAHIVQLMLMTDKTSLALQHIVHS